MQYPEDSFKSGAFPEESMRGSWQNDDDSVQGGVENSVAAGKRNYRAIKKTYRRACVPKHARAALQAGR